MDTYATSESRALAEARALARLSVAVARASTTRSVAEILLNELFAGLPGATAAVALLDERGGEFELVGVRSASSRPINTVARWSAGLPSPARDVVASGQPLVLDGAAYLERYPAVSRISDPSGIARYVALPIIAGVRAIGAVGLSWDEEPHLDDEALAHLQSLVDAGAQALGRARLEDAAQRSRDIVTAMVDQMPLGVLIVEPTGGPEPTDLRPLYMNTAFLEIFGVRKEMAASDPLPSVMRVDGSPSPEAERPLVRATFSGEVIRDELYRLATPDRSERVVSINAGPVRTADGQILAGVAVYVDVTGRIDAEAARDAFLGVLSHELRTPITSIIAAAEILRRRVGQDPVAADVASGLADDGHRLYRLVENLLVLSRVERGADLRRDDPVLLHHVVRRVIAYAADRWPGRRFELVSPATVSLIAGDDGYLEQILENLLSNAVKYAGAADPITVVVEEQAGEVRLRVLDRGPGFPDGHEGRAFELFYRDPSTERIAPGAGIGLYVVDALATAMGGRVWAANREGGGAEVGVGLPAIASGQEPAPGIPRRGEREAD